MLGGSAPAFAASGLELSWAVRLCRYGRELGGTGAGQPGVVVLEVTQELKAGYAARHQAAHRFTCAYGVVWILKAKPYRVQVGEEGFGIVIDGLLILTWYGVRGHRHSDTRRYTEQR